MNSSGIGFLLSLAFLAVAAIWTSPDRPFRFLDPHGGFIVVMGTAIIGIIAVPWEYVKKFFSMIRVVSRSHKDDSVEVMQQLLEMAEKSRVDIAKIKDVQPKIKDLFLKDAVLILLEGFEAQDIETILRRRIEVQKEREMSDAKMFKSLGKYPPATGLIGTVMGMIVILGSLGKEGAESLIGPSMSVAMSATLYGIIIANIIILPVADNLIFRTQKLIAKRELIIEGILLVKQKTSPTMVREILLSHLSPQQRDLYLKTAKTPKTAKAA